MDWTDNGNDIAFESFKGYQVEKYGVDDAEGSKMDEDKTNTARL